MTEFRTHPNKKRYPINSDDPYAKIARDEENLQPATSSDAPDESFYCVVCQESKYGSHFEVNGESCCAECMADYKSGRMQKEANYARAQTVMSPSPSSDYSHTHMGICSVCAAPHQRNLCSDGHNACFNCRPPGCSFKR